MRTRRTETVMSIAVALIVVGCAHYKDIMPPDKIDTKYHGKMEILSSDGTTYRLDGCTIGVERVTGWGTRFMTDGTNRDFVGSVGFNEILLVKTDHVDRLASLLLAGSVGVLVGGTLSAIESDKPYVNVQVTYPSSGGGMGGSCPYAFSFDGASYHLESETFAGAVCPALERTATDVLHDIKPVNGLLRVAVANQSPESQHINEVSLLSIEHAAGTTIMIDGKGVTHTVRRLDPPLSAVAYSGCDVTDEVSRIDTSFWQSDSAVFSNPLAPKYRDGLICTFARPACNSTAKLIITGRNTSLGYFALETLFALRGPNKLSQYYRLANNPDELSKLRTWMKNNGGIDISIMSNGEWQTVSWLPDVGPRVETDRVVPIDLKAYGDSVVTVKLETTSDLWRIDRVAVDYSRDEILSARQLKLISARRETDADISDEITSADSEYVRLLPGEYSVLDFAAPEQAADRAVSVLLKSSGYYYSWTNDDAVDHSDVAEAILANAPEGRQALLSKWIEERSRWERLYANNPVFPIEEGF